MRGNSFIIENTLRIIDVDLNYPMRAKNIP